MNDREEVLPTRMLNFPRSTMLPCLRARQRVYFPLEKQVRELDNILVRIGNLGDRRNPHDIVPHEVDDNGNNQRILPNEDCTGTDIAEAASQRREQMLWDGGDEALQFLDRVNDESVADAYQLKERLQSTHFGPVYKSYELRELPLNDEFLDQYSGPTIDWMMTQKICAIKDLGWNRIRHARQRNQDEDACEDAIRECDALQYFRDLDIDSPNILDQKDLLYDERSLYSVLPFYNEGELFDRMRKIANLNQNFEEDEARYFIREILNGVQWLHDVSGVCHRDIKPENIMLHYPSNTFAGVHLSDVVLIDFGACGRVPFDRDTRQPRLVRRRRVGTQQYRSPESYIEFGGTGAIDAFKSDMWSVGVVCYSILTNRMPCEEARRSNLRFRYIERNRLIDLINHDSTDRGNPLSDLAKDFLLGLLCVDPSNRLSAGEALQHQWMTGETNVEPLDDDYFAWFDAELEVRMEMD